MTSPRWRLGSSIGLYAIGMMATAAVGLAVVPLYTRLLGPADYGSAEATVALLNVGVAILLLGLDAALAIVLHGEPERIGAGSVAATALFVGLAGSVPASIAVFAAADPIACSLISCAQADTVRVAALGLVPSVLVAILVAILRNLGLPGAFLRVAVAQGFGLVVVGVALLAVGAGPVAVLGGLAGGSFLGAATAGWQLRTMLRPSGVRRSLACTLLRIGLPLVPAGIALWVIAISDRLLLLQLASAADVGLYTAAGKIAVAAALAVSAFTLAWSPFALRVQRERLAPSLYGGVLTAYSAAAAAATILSALIAEPAIRLLAGDAYSAASSVVWSLVASAFVYGGYLIVAIGVQIKRRTSVISLTTGLAAVLNIGANLVLIPFLGFNGAGIATLLAYLVSAILLFIFAQRSHRIPYESGRVLMVTSVGLVAAWVLSSAVLPPAVWVLVVAGAIGTVGVVGVPAGRRIRPLVGAIQASADTAASSGGEERPR